MPQYLLILIILPKNNLVKITINFYNKKFKLPFFTNMLESEAT